MRASKVRNIYADKVKADNTFAGLKFTQPGATDAQGIKANDRYIAVSVKKGSGSVAIVEHATPKRQDNNTPVLFHKNTVIDFDFNPFHQNLIASGDDAGAIMVWGIPKDGLTETTEEPLVELEGEHDKAVNNVLFHPCADHVLATGSTDAQVKIFDVMQEKAVHEMKLDDPVFHLSWNRDGTILGITSKDKKLRLVDPRSFEQISEKVVHPGPKTIKSIFTDNFGPGKGSMATMGFSVQSKRQLKLWDYRKMTAELCKVDIDNTNSVFMPFYDETLNTLFLQGRGEKKARVFELVDDNPWQFEVFNDTLQTAFNEPIKGACMLPKRCVDVMRDGTHQNKGPEVMRMYVASQKGVQPITWVIPRKSTKFWPELFENEAYAGKSTLDAEAFFSKSKQPKVVTESMNPKKDGAVTKRKGLAGFGGDSGGAAAAKPKMPETIPGLKKEVERLRKILDENNISY